MGAREGRPARGMNCRRVGDTEGDAIGQPPGAPRRMSLPGSRPPGLPFSMCVSSCGCSRTPPGSRRPGPPLSMCVNSCGCRWMPPRPRPPGPPLSMCVSSCRCSQTPPQSPESHPGKDLTGQHVRKLLPHQFIRLGTHLGLQGADVQPPTISRRSPWAREADTSTPKFCTNYLTSSNLNFFFHQNVYQRPVWKIKSSDIWKVMANPDRTLPNRDRAGLAMTQFDIEKRKLEGMKWQRASGKGAKLFSCC